MCCVLVCASVNVVISMLCIGVCQCECCDQCVSGVCVKCVYHIGITQWCIQDLKKGGAKSIAHRACAQ